MEIVISAGESSGDILGGKLCEELRQLDKNISLSGIGGQAMRKAGVDTLHDVSETAVIGIYEVLKHYPRLHKILSNLKRHIQQTQPKLLILIDYPEFNLKLAAYAKSLNIKVMFYVSPQIWAWRTGRVKKIKQRVDLMAVLFPFELDFYRKENINSCLVRHPLLQEVEKYIPVNSLQMMTVALAPGSRKSEVKKLFPIMLKAAVLLHDENPSLRFIVPVAPGFNKSDLIKQLDNLNIPITFEESDFYSTIDKSDVVMIASGTASLQTALMGKAMVIVYKISPITYRLFGHMIKVKHISLANIILNKRVFTELLQKEVSPENLYEEIKMLLDDNQRQDKMNEVQTQLYNMLNQGCNSKELAEKAMQLAVN
ncbi:MAG: lipid-A-disaccharide synthase [Pseudomonadota bacterium]